MILEITETIGQPLQRTSNRLFNEIYDFKLFVIMDCHVMVLSVTRSCLSLDLILLGPQVPGTGSRTVTGLPTETRSVTGRTLGQLSRDSTRVGNGSGEWSLTTSRLLSHLGVFPNLLSLHNTVILLLFNGRRETRGNRKS